MNPVGDSSLMMAIKVRDLDIRDCNRAAEFAAIGMQLYRYVPRPTALKLYSRYFLYEELLKSTCSYAAYIDGEFKGLLLASMKGEERIYSGLRGRFYRDLFRTLGGDGEANYYAANDELLAELRRTVEPDGEIGFLAADPVHPVKGIGTALLSAFERDHPGSTVYVFTDDTCSYEFYEHRGFRLAGERTITETDGTTEFPLRCFIYVKRIVGRSPTRDPPMRSSHRPPV